MLDVQSAQRLQGLAKILRLEDVDAGIVQRREPRDRRTVRENYRRGLARGFDDLRGERSFSVVVEYHPHWRDTRADRATHGQLRVLRAEKNRNHCQRLGAWGE